jgi:hypothetical protein
MAEGWKMILFFVVCEGFKGANSNDHSFTLKKIDIVIIS